MTKPKFSVAICTYNGCGFIWEQLESIVNQTYPPSEIVICDDCSTDNTCEIVETFSAEHPNLVRLYKNPQNIGRNKNFEQAIGLCTGDIIALSDQDDVFLPHKFESIARVFASDRTYGLVFSNATIVKGDLSVVSESLFSEIWPPFSERRRKQFNYDAFKAIIRNRPALGCSIAFRKELIRFLLPIPAEFSHDAWIMLLSSLFSRIRFTNESLVLYRQHDTNIAGVQKGIVGKLRKRIAGRSAEDFHDEVSLELACWETLWTRIEMLSMGSMQLPQVSCENAQLIKDKVDYLRQRKRISERQTCFMTRVAIMIRLLLSGKYFLFEQGIYSLFRDAVVTFLRIKDCAFHANH